MFFVENYECFLNVLCWKLWVLLKCSLLKAMTWSVGSLWAFEETSRWTSLRFGSTASIMQSCLKLHISVLEMAAIQLGTNEPFLTGLVDRCSVGDHEGVRCSWDLLWIHAAELALPYLLTHLWVNRFSFTYIDMMQSKSARNNGRKY